MRTHSKAFTLIELLVVIAIIAILAAILFPVFARARERAKMSACLSNTRQIGLCLNQYAEDHEGAFPANTYEPVLQRTRLWPHLFLPYAKSAEIFRCPSHAGKPGTYVAGKTDPERMLYTGWSVSTGPVPATPNRDTWYTREIPGIGYAFNEMVIGLRDPNNGFNYTKRARTIGSLKNPAEIAIFGDGAYLYGFWSAQTENGRTVYYWYRGKKGTDDYWGTPQHFGGNSFVYADGHSSYDRPTGPENGPGFYRKAVVWRM